MNLFNLYKEAIEINGFNKVMAELNLARGTLKRWEEKKEVPSQYCFDLMRLCKKNIDYSQFSFKEKDQYFTPKTTVEFCINALKECLLNNGIDINEYVFIEPSAGDGAFLNFLPKNTIAMDIEPRSNNIIEQDFFLWTPPKREKFIVIGNPPFGLRGQQALKFINKALTFADFCCFILPPLFNSSWKGAPGKRVNGNLILSIDCDNNYYYPDNSPVSVQTIFQIWTRLNIPTILEQEENPINFSIYSMSDGGTPSSTRNKDKIGKCDFYLPSTVFGIEKMIMYYDFEELPQRRGYGIILNDKNDLIKIQKIDWSNIAFNSTNGAYNLRMSYIIKTLNNKLTQN